MNSVISDACCTEPLNRRNTWKIAKWQIDANRNLVFLLISLDTSFDSFCSPVWSFGDPTGSYWMLTFHGKAWKVKVSHAKAMNAIQMLWLHADMVGQHGTILNASSTLLPVYVPAVLIKAWSLQTTENQSIPKSWFGSGHGQLCSIKDG